MKLTIIFAALILLASPALAWTKKAQCFLQVDGVVRIDGICDMTSTHLNFTGEPPGGFEIGNGTGERFGDNFGDHDRSYGWFAFVNPNGDGTANATWNGEYGESHAMDDLPTLTKNGACWVNGNTKVCAWKVGEDRGNF